MPIFCVEKSRSSASVCCISCQFNIISHEKYAGSITHTHTHTPTPQFIPFRIKRILFHFAKITYLWSALILHLFLRMPLSPPFSRCWGSHFKWHRPCDTSQPRGQGGSLPLLASTALFSSLLLLPLNHIKAIHVTSYHEYRDTNSCLSLYKILIFTPALGKCASNYFI